MATAVPPQPAPLSSATFITVEEFEAKLSQGPDVSQSIAQHAAQTQIQRNPFAFAMSQNGNTAASDRAVSDAASSIASSTPDLAGKNWIGRLLEYQQAHPGLAPPSFNERPVPGLTPRFVCFVTIAVRPEPFGAITQSFSRKKDAKHYACKLAIEWLVENGHMPSVDSVTFPKIQPLMAHQPLVSGPATTTPSPAAPSTATSVAAMVVQLCQELRMNQPTYVMNSEPAAPMFWSGYAHFPGDPRVDGKIGEFLNIFGKKNAKEHCAMAVLEFLNGLKGHRDNVRAKE